MDLWQKVDTLDQQNRLAEEPSFLNMQVNILSKASYYPCLKYQHYTVIKQKKNLQCSKEYQNCPDIKTE